MPNQRDVRERFTRHNPHKLLRRILHSAVMNLRIQPLLQWSEFTAGKLAIQIAELLTGRREELRGKHVPQGICRKIANAAEAPMNVLQATVYVIRRGQAEVASESLVPSCGNIRRFQIAIDQRLFQFESQHDVQIVSRFISLHAYVGGLNVVDRPIEIL